MTDQNPFQPLVKADFTIVVHDATKITATDGGGGINVVTASHGNPNVWFAYKAVPSVPYVIEVNMRKLNWPTGYSSIGVGWGDDSDKVVSFENYNANTAGFQADQLLVTYYSTTSSARDIKSTTNPTPIYDMRWYQLRDDGTNRYCDASRDGINWVNIYSVGRTDTITPTRIGLVVNGYSAALTAQFNSWKTISAGRSDWTTCSTSDFTIYVDDSSKYTNTNSSGGIDVVATAKGSQNNQFFYKSVDVSQSFSVVVNVDTVSGSNWFGLGIFGMTPPTGYSIGYYGIGGIEVLQHNPLNIIQSEATAKIQWFKITYSATDPYTWNYYYSTDGVSWTLYWTQNYYLNPVYSCYVGIIMDGWNAGKWRINSWNLTYS